MNMNELSGRRPLAVIGVVSGLGFGVIMGLLAAFFNGGSTPWLSVLLGAVGGIFFGSCFAWVIAQQRRELGGPVIARSVQTAIRGRVLPNAVDDAWVTGLGHRKRQTTRYRWVTPALFALFTGVGVLNLMGSVTPGWLAWVQIVGFPALAFVSVVRANSELRAIAQLEQQLRQRDG